MDASLLIIGAGPAGLLAALAAAKRRLRHGVLVLERLAMPGVKLSATGGTRGNLSHHASEDDFVAAFGRSGRFTLPAFRALPPAALQELLAAHGCPTTVDATGRIYPRSQSAGQCRDALYAAARQAGVRFELGHHVCGLHPPDSPTAPWHVDQWIAHSVLLAAGGQSAAYLGSDGSGLALARDLGYAVTPPVPALTALHTVETWPATHSGLSLPDVTLSLAAPRATPCRGEILFTHRGISGPAALNLAGQVARGLLRQPTLPLRLNLLPSRVDVAALRRTAGATLVLTWLAQQVPRALAHTLLHLAAIPDTTPLARLTAPQQERLLATLHDLPLTIHATGGFRESMATAGGVALKQVKPDTLGGRLTPRLYFAGEILDLVGPTGGWNLQWAFCSGHLVGSQAGAAVEA